MTFKKFEWWIILRVVLLFIVLFTAAFLILDERYVYLAMLVPLIVYQFVEFIRFQRKAHDELSQFVEAVHYRDFSTHFDVKHAPRRPAAPS